MSVVSSLFLQRFARLFSGYEGAHGRYSITGKKENGKMGGKGRTIHEAITDKIWREHLDGTGDGAGIIPLRSDDHLCFAAIDVDVYNLDVPALAKRAAAYGLVACRSKSGGAHLYMFFHEPQPAEPVIELMHDLAARLGHGGVEVFPKQTTRTSQRDTGNWINIPYVNHESGLRYGVHSETGEALSLEEFLDYAEAARLEEVPGVLPPWEEPEPEEDRGLPPPDNEAEASQPRARRPRTPPPENAGLFEDGPPCLQHIAVNGGFPDGTRNAALFNTGVYLRRRYPDDWQDRLMAYNQKLCNPPGSLRDIQEQVKSLGRKEYSYLCKQPPIAAHCNRRLCVKRQFGVGNTPASAGIEITGITKYPANPVLWCVEVDGNRIELDTETLFNHGRFSLKLMEAINRVPPPLNADRWRRYLDEKLQDCDEVPPPEDVSDDVQFVIYVENWLTGRTQAKTRDELLLGKPFRDAGRIFFLSNALRTRMDNDRFRYNSMHEVWANLKKMGARQEEPINVRGKFRRPWSVPDPEQRGNGAAARPENDEPHEEAF